MSIEISRTYELLISALDYRSSRQDLIASNIANVDTPNYKPRDISFEEALTEKKDLLLNKEKNSLKMAQTNSNHLQAQEEVSKTKPTLFFRDGHMARNDGNSVDIDVETTELSKNSIMYNALVKAMRKDALIFQSVIDASQKIN